MSDEEELPELAERAIEDAAAIFVSLDALRVTLGRSISQYTLLNDADVVPFAVGRVRHGAFEEFFGLSSPPPSPPAGAPSCCDSSDDEAAAPRVVPPSPGAEGPRRSTTRKRGKGISPDQLASEMPSPKGAALQGSSQGASLQTALQQQRSHSVEATPLERPRRLRARFSAVQTLREKEAAEALAAARAKLEAKLAPYGGRCWWCWAEGCPHDPDLFRCCDAKEYPMMESAPSLTRRAAKGHTKPQGRKQTALTAAYAKWRQGQKNEHRRQSKALRSAAQQRLLDHLEAARAADAAAATAAATPIPPSGPLGQYTFYDKVAFEFAMRLHKWMSVDQLERAPGSVNSHALQLFAKQVKAAGLPSLDAARTRGDTAIKGFVALREQLVNGPLCAQYHQLISAAHIEERIKYGSLPAVMELNSSSPTLLEILGAVRKATEPKRGAPKSDASGTSIASSSGVAAANNWVDGGYSPEAMDRMDRFRARGINASLKTSQADIIEATNLMTTGMPRSLTEFRAFRPSKRPGAISCSSTAALHAAQLNEYEVEEAMESVEIWFPHVDAGSKRGVAAMLGGTMGLLKGVESESAFTDEDVYQDALGMEILSQKTGAAAAASIVRMFARRGVHEYYFVTSDAANDMTGHKEGVIAFLRRDRDCVAIFVNRCLAHITARSLKHMLQAETSSLKVDATRTSLKRKKARARGKRARAANRRAHTRQELAHAEEEEEDGEAEGGGRDGGEGGEGGEDDASAELPPELKLLEDLFYIDGLWPGLREEIQKRQLEFAKKISGAPESRWTFWKELLVQKVGATQILARLVRVWTSAIALHAILTGTSPEQAREDADELVLDEKLDAHLPLTTVEKAIAADEWLNKSFDFSEVTFDDPDMIFFSNLLAAYTGNWMLDALDVTAQMLNPDGIEIEELRAEGATLAPPAACRVSAITAETLPPLLVDIASQTMRMRLMIEEVIAATYVGPHLAFIEERRSGIFWDGHRLIGMHQDVADLFCDDDVPWETGNVAVLNIEYALGLEVVTAHAERVGLEDEAHTFVSEKMVEYAEYHRPQTEEWWGNPTFRVGGLGSPESNAKCEDHGVWHARHLVQEGRAELIAALARYAHCTVDAMRACLTRTEHRGPMKLLVDDELWAQLVAFAQQELTLWECDGVDDLRNLVYRHYKGLHLTNVWAEELVKEFKNLSPQARAHPASAEIRILAHQRRVRGRRYFPLPTRARLKLIRRKLGHHLRRRARPKRQAPAEPLPSVVWAGHDGSEEEEDDDEGWEDADDEESEDDIESLTVPELKARLGALSVQGLSSLRKADLVARLKEELGMVAMEAALETAIDEGEDDDGEPEEDDEDEAAMSASEKVILELLGKAPNIARSELSAGRAFFCWDDDRKLNYFPVVLTESVRPRARVIRVKCLTPAAEARGVYVVDPIFNGETGDDKKDNARIDLLFDARPITSEVWRPIEGGYAGEVEAWRVVKRA